MQATRLGRLLAKDKFHFAFASDLKRAHVTCKLVLSQQTSDGNKSVPQIEPLKCLRERYYGVIEDRPISELNKLAQEAKQKVPDFVPENAESLPEMQQRAREFLEHLYRRISSANTAEWARFEIQFVKSFMETEFEEQLNKANSSQNGNGRNFSGS